MRTRVQKLKNMSTIAPHYGRRMTFLRNLFKLTQTQLGQDAGYSQQDISDFEGQAVITDEVLERLLKPVGISVERFKGMDESVMGQMVFNMYENQNAIGHFGYNSTNNVNPLEELLKAQEENKKLYERLLEAEKEKNAHLQRQLDASR